MSDSPFKMPGSQFLGKGNQSVTPGKYTASPAKDTDPHKTTDTHKAHEKKKVEKKESGYDPRTASGGEQVLEGFKTMGRTIIDPVKKVAKKVYKTITN